MRFTLLTIWSDLEAIRRYAGDDIDAARLYPGDDHFGLVPDLRAAQHDILHPANIHLASTSHDDRSDGPPSPGAPEHTPLSEELPRP